MTNFTSNKIGPAPERALEWLRRWDAQQERYVPDRDERFAVIGDVVAAVVADASSPVVVDLGAGPGSLSVRLLDRIPHARLVAVDADPLLLGLARSAYGDRAGLHVVEHDLRDEGWAAAAHLRDGSVDAIVSTTALHWLTGPQLAAVYATAGRLLRPGGVLVDGDHLLETDGRAQLRHLTRVVRDARVRRVGTGANEDWAAWWDAVGRAPELANLFGARGARPIEHEVPDLPSLDDHVRYLRDAGFTEVGTVWQHGDDRVLVGVR
ncbi:trans-aconitate 2-methyltransferase [Allobranchiibius sp. GilTou73]|uniref:class I SAM-dependent methyltransferase n=1 Tax=Allobranchiibius sp. GilTou73 TaxID=2904523 RepID=UPI001F406484|nr:class I SAM-dependent methyltransferase [Allobranchiibius sp. GilTou73]UIJ35451.1 class I SAM-dependent methyltransferase [Allobranchiibius sp. GilTou73]